MKALLRPFIFTMFFLSQGALAGVCEKFAGTWTLNPQGNNQKWVEVVIKCENNVLKIDSVKGDAATIQKIRVLEVLKEYFRDINITQFSYPGLYYTQVYTVEEIDDRVLEITSELINNLGQVVDYATWTTTITYIPDGNDINYDSILIQSCKYDDHANPCEETLEFRQIVHSL